MPVSPRRQRLDWSGWYRTRGGAWQPLCDARTYDDAWRALLDEVGKGRSGEWVVLRVGRRP
jgi:hypothetical protein